MSLHIKYFICISYLLFLSLDYASGRCGIQEIEPVFQNQPFSVIDGQLVEKTRFRRILGGDSTQHGSWPWIVKLTMHGSIGLSSCGGVLIDKSWVLTAAHCLKDKYRISVISAKAGFHDLSEPQVQTRYGKNSYIHEKYNANQIKNDIALVELRTPFKMTKHVHTVCLPPSGYIVPAKTFCVVAGVGRMKNYRYPNHLKQAVLPVHSYEDCILYMGSSMRDNTQMCAGWRGPGNEHDTCKGDSGGPLLCLLDKRWTVQGITSWSFTDPCFEGRAYVGSYTRVSKYMSWINDKIGKTENEVLNGT